MQKRFFLFFVLIFSFFIQIPMSSFADNYEGTKNSLLMQFKKNTLEDDKKTFELAIKALTLSSKIKIEEDADIFLMVANKLFEKSLFHESYILNESLFKKTCLLNYKRKGVLFKNSIVIALTQKKIEEALDIFDMAKMCKVESTFQYKALTSLVGQIELLNDPQKKLARLNQFSLFDQYTPFLISKIKIFRDEYKEKKNSELIFKLENLLETYYKKHKNKRGDFDLDDVDAFASYSIEKLSPFIHQYQEIDMTKENPRKEDFKKIFEIKMAHLQKIEKKIKEIISFGSAQMAYKTYKILADQYGHLSSQMDTLILSEEYKNDLQVLKVLGDIKRKMKDKVSYLANKQKEILVKYDVLFSKDNDSIEDLGTLPLGGAEVTGHLMDRDGEKNNE